MNTQNSYSNDYKTLYIIPTPIGNLDDITIRALNTLKTIDYLFCEDTRVTKKLLSHFNLSIILHSYHMHNEKSASQQVIKYLKNGYNVGLVSDAGMPLISDPGIELIDKVRAQNFNVTVLPGSSAFVVGAVGSGLIYKDFYFYGFLNKSTSKRIIELKTILNYNFPTIIYETPHKLITTLKQLFELDQNRIISISREISKLFEEYNKGTVKEILEYYSQKKIKGEFVIVINKNTNIEKIDNPIEYYNELIKKNISKKEAIKIISRKMNVKKNDIYQLIIKDENE